MDIHCFHHMLYTSHSMRLLLGYGKVAKQTNCWRKSEGHFGLGPNLKLCPFIYLRRCCVTCGIPPAECFFFIMISASPVSCVYSKVTPAYSDIPLSSLH